MTEIYVKLKRILFMAGFIIALGIPLMFLMEDFIHDAIITPLAYVAWLIGVIVDALPQSYLLGALIAVVLYAAARSLMREPPPIKKQKLTSAAPEGSAAAWYRKLDLTTKGAYSQRRIQQHVGNLILHVIAYEQRLPVREVVQNIQAGEFEIPDDVTVYIEAATYRGLPRAPSLLARIKAYILGTSAPKSAGSSIATDLDPALRYIETQLRTKKAEEANEPIFTPEPE